MDFVMYYSFSFGMNEDPDDTGVHEFKQWYCAEHYDRFEAMKKAFIQG